MRQELPMRLGRGSYIALKEGMVGRLLCETGLKDESMHYVRVISVRIDCQGILEIGEALCSRVVHMTLDATSILIRSWGDGVNKTLSAVSMKRPSGRVAHMMPDSHPHC